MKEVGEIELAIQGQTEEIEQLGRSTSLELYSPSSYPFDLIFTGEAGKVEESMAKLEAVEALKSEKAEKEVSYTSCSESPEECSSTSTLRSESCSDSPKRVVLQVIRSFVSVKPVVPTSPC